MKTITREQYLQLVGLLKLADTHDEQLTGILCAVREIVPEDLTEPFSDHTSDAVYNAPDRDADRLLKVMGYEVEAPPEPVHAPPSGPTDRERVDWLQNAFLGASNHAADLVGLPGRWHSLRDAVDRAIEE